MSEAVLVPRRCITNTSNSAIHATDNRSTACCGRFAPGPRSTLLQCPSFLRAAHSLKCRLYRCRHLRQISGCDLPNPRRINLVIRVAEHVSERPHRLPWRPRRKLLGLGAELGCRLAQAFEASLNRVTGPPIRVEPRPIHTLQVGLDQPDIIQDVLQADGGTARRHVRLPA